MSINKNYKFIQIFDEDLVAEGKRLGLDEIRAAEIVEQILSDIPVTFETAGREFALEKQAQRILEGLGTLSAARFVSNYWT